MPGKIPTHRPAWMGTPRQAAAAYDRGRREDKAFYDSAPWLRLSAAYKAAHPLCEPCLAADRLTPVEQVHHRLDRKARPDLALEWSNLESVCRACHNAKRRKP